jgi:hypothetical protein
VAIWRFVFNFKLEVTMSDQVVEKNTEKTIETALEKTIEKTTDNISGKILSGSTNRSLGQVLEHTPAKLLDAVINQPFNLDSKNSAPEIQLDPALIAELCEVTSDPSQAVNIAIRQWLQRRAIKEADSSRPLSINPIVPPRGEWND